MWDIILQVWSGDIYSALMATQVSKWMFCAVLFGLPFTWLFFEGKGMVNGLSLIAYTSFFCSYGYFLLGYF